MAFRLGIVAGEASGDALGARAVKALRAQLKTQCNEDLVVEGIGGPDLQAAGCRSLYPMEALSVMGITEPLKRLPQLLRIRRGLVKYFGDNPPDVFLGIDSPDFNLTLERRLRNAGVPIAHLVSPSVWAWRAGRVKTIARSVDRMLYLFPFEGAVYSSSGVKAEFVGHPLADDTPMTLFQAEARESLQLASEGRVVTLLPGSRVSEIQAHGSLFVDVARQLYARDSSLSFLLPVANQACERTLEPLLRGVIDIPIKRLHKNSTAALAACDAALVVSGTATLEAALVKRPMVAVYKTGAVSWAVLSRLVRTPYVSLPNLLHGGELVPEFLQSDATGKAVSEAMWQQLEDTSRHAALHQAFGDIHDSLRQGCAEKVSAALLTLAGVPIAL